MSRFVHKQGTITVAYGCDRVLGWFADVFDSDMDEDCPIEEHYGKAAVVECLHRYGVRRDHITMIVLDIEPGA